MSKKISQLTAVTTVADTDVLPVVNSSETKKVTKSNLLKEVNAEVDTKADQTALDAHTSSTANPHSVTKAQVGLSNVTNDAQVKVTDIGVTVPSLTGGKIPSSQLPAIAISDTFVVASQAAMLALTAEIGDVAIRTDLSKTYILKGSDPTVLSNWELFLTAPPAWGSITGTLSGQTDLQTVLDAKQYKTTVTVGFSNADYIVDGVADDVEIQAAIDYVSGLGGGEVRLKFGIYTIYSPINLKSNTLLTGAGMSNTVLKIDPASIDNFISKFILNKSTAINCKISKLSLDGNYANLVSPSSTRGGLLEIGNNWDVEDIEFMSSNYFKLWINNVVTANIRRCKWTGLVGSGNDCIGGGSNSSNITIKDCTWVSGVNGNIIDLTGPTTKNIKFINNHNFSASTAYFEAVVDSYISGNIFVGGGSIVLQSDSTYGSHTDATNPKNNIISNNAIYDATGFGISIKYSVKGTTVKGGYNQILGNKIVRAGRAGIIIFPSVSTTSTDSSYGYDIINGNECINNNQLNEASYNTGTSIINSSGINITKGLNYIITNNICVDDQITPTQHHGIQLGQTSSPSDINEPDNIICSNNFVFSNKTEGVHIVSPTYTTSYQLFNNYGNIGEVITIDSSNSRLGINKSNPTEALDVIGNIKLSGLNLSVGSGTATGDKTLRLSDNSGNDDRVVMRQTSTNDIFLGDIDANGGKVFIRSNGISVIYVDTLQRTGINIASPTSTLHSGGSFALPYLAKTAAYTLTANDYTVDVTTGTNTQTLPTAVGIAGRIYVIKNTGTGVVTVATTSSQTIDGATTYSLATQYQSVTVQSNGANWVIVNKI